MFANPLLLLPLRCGVWPLSLWLATGLCVLMTSDALDLRRLGDMKPWHFCPSLRIFTLGTQTPCSENLSYMQRPHICAPVSVPTPVELSATATPTHVNKLAWMSKPVEVSEDSNFGIHLRLCKRFHGRSNQPKTTHRTTRDSKKFLFCH